MEILWGWCKFTPSPSLIFPGIRTQPLPFSDKIRLGPALCLMLEQSIYSSLDPALLLTWSVDGVVACPYHPVVAHHLVWTTLVPTATVAHQPQQFQRTSKVEATVLHERQSPL